MTKQQENRAFVKMLKEFPKAFGRVSFRERLMLRTAFTYVAEEVINDLRADLKANFDYILEGKNLENNKLLDVINNQDVKIADLEKENKILERRIIRAKNCMKKLLFIINSEPSNYNCKGLVQDAEDFIYNRTCNIRKSGNHCITEEPCIMCDKE